MWWQEPRSLQSHELHSFFFLARGKRFFRVADLRRVCQSRVAKHKSTFKYGEMASSRPEAANLMASLPLLASGGGWGQDEEGKA